MPEDVTAPELRPSIRVQAAMKSFDGRVVVDVADLTLGRYPIEGLIGPNGAGKTTLMRMVMHSIKLDRGRISFLAGDGSASEVVLSSLPPHAIARLGVVKTNQVIQDFEHLTIWDSLLLAASRAHDERPYRIFRERRVWSQHGPEIEEYLDLLPFDNPFGFAKSAGEKVAGPDGSGGGKALQDAKGRENDRQSCDIHAGQYSLISSLLSFHGATRHGRRRQIRPQDLFA